MPNAGMDFELRLNSPDGALIGSGRMPRPSEKSQGALVRIPLNKAFQKIEKLYFVYKPKEKDKFAKGIFVAISSVQFSGD